MGSRHVPMWLLITCSCGVLPHAAEGSPSHAAEGSSSHAAEGSSLHGAEAPRVSLPGWDQQLS